MARAHSYRWVALLVVLIHFFADYKLMMMVGSFEGRAFIYYWVSFSVVNRLAVALIVLDFL